jgi:hypothetical protein
MSRSWSARSWGQINVLQHERTAAPRTLIPYLPSGVRAITEVPQVGQNCIRREWCHRDERGWTYLVCHRVLPECVALEGAIYVTFHDGEVFFGGKAPHISILRSSRSATSQ